jgi:hypothetical protein
MFVMWTSCCPPCVTTGGQQWELAVHGILVLVHHLVVTIAEADVNVNADAVDINIDNYLTPSVAIAESFPASKRRRLGSDRDG